MQRKPFGPPTVTNTTVAKVNRTNEELGSGPAGGLSSQLFVVFRGHRRVLPPGEVEDCCCTTRVCGGGDGGVHYGEYNTV